MSVDDIIRKAYYNPSEGFVGREKLYRKLRPHRISRSDIAKFLVRQEVYQTSRKNNKRQGSFIPRYPLQEFQIDLIYIDDKHLNQASYGLCCIDAFSKKADIELMKRKTKGETVDSMIAILERMGVPDMIYCDEGSEFNNAPFKALCTKMKIKLIFTIRHAPIVERFNRTIKEMIHKYLQSTNTKTITNVLKQMLHNYNNSYHSVIGMAPNEVTEDTQHIAQINLIRKLRKPSHTNLKVGDKVRVQVKPKSFVKGYRPKYSKEVFEVTEVGSGYYLTTKDDRKYLRSNLQKVESYEINPEKPNLEGTAEGRLRTMRSQARVRPAAEIEEEDIQERQSRRRLRERKPVSQLEDSEYGRVRYS